MQPTGFFTIIRPLNSCVAGIAVLLGYLIAVGTIAAEAFLLVPVVFFATAGGNVINDYYDREIDRINRPNRPIPSGAVTPVAARAYSAVLFLAAIGLSTFTNPLCMALAVFNSLLLWAYAARLKKVPLVGNLAVAYLAANIFLFGGALAGIDGLLQNVPLAGIVVLAMLSRELLKDVEDMEGDAEGGARTLPMIVGVRATAAVALAAALGAVIMSYLPLMRWWGGAYLAAITVADLVILAGALRGFRCGTPACIRSSCATGLLKGGMFAALLVFIIAAIFV
ncbi:MAG: geranylgeranylglycerol-phosphate geranylgeranyltransferase [Methanomicrobiaceae archaeon]|nr:geranylgeranylglycerol-phosphate geranylgeranyltransferase [Methanomicrobiaceae archaeon]